MSAAHPIGRPGIDPIHFSQLKAMGQSALHYRHRLENAAAETKALRLGRAVDAILFGTCGVVGFDGQRRGKEWAAFAQANAGAICLNKTEHEQVLGMSDAIERHEEAMDLLSTGTRQKLVEWTISGRSCAGTPDTFTEGRVVELKTCRSADPRRFVWDARRLGYHAQLSWYQEGLLQSGRARPPLAFIVAVESIAPHPVTVFALTDRALDQGMRAWRLWFEQLRVCEESDAWPAYAEQAVPFDLPEEEEGGTKLVIGGEEVEID